MPAQTAENFRQLCTGEAGIGTSTGLPLHFKGAPFHRIIRGFMIQARLSCWICFATCASSVPLLHACGQEQSRSPVPLGPQGGDFSARNGTCAPPVQLALCPCPPCILHSPSLVSALTLRDHECPLPMQPMQAVK